MVAKWAILVIIMYNPLGKVFIMKKKRFTQKRNFQMSPTRIIAIVFAAIILVGTLLLSLPVASRSGQSCGIRPALFTATSATCVTGLVLFDTWTQWSGFGQVVIITLIELGGLGFMSAAAIVVFLLRKKVGLKQRLLMAQALSLNDMQGVVHLQKTVLLGSLAVQGAGALVLTLRFLPQWGLRQALIWGVFHAVSAFCNAGFDIFGSFAPGMSIIPFNNDPVVCTTLMCLVIVGGLGFFVWEELVRVRSFQKCSVYTKLVLLTTVSLITTGFVLFVTLEWNNPGTLGPMSVGQKILNALFQSVTLRTAGFASVDQSLLTDGSKAISVLWMLIGGSSGSTAGGIKTGTMVVILLFIWSRARGKSTVNVFKHSISQDKVLDALTIAAIMLGLTFVGTVLVSVSSQLGFLDSLYEVSSAMATVGLTAGVTPSLSIPAQYVIILLMYFGRVGVLTISLGFMMSDKAQDRFQYSYTNMLIG